MQDVAIIGLDLAKSVFQVHGVDRMGDVVVRRMLLRAQVIDFFRKLPACLIFSIVDLGEFAKVMSEHEWLAGCNIAFDRAALIEAGGFDLKLGRIGNAAALLSNEESLACDRIRRLGKAMIYAPSVAVNHFIPAERANWDWIVRRIAWQAVSDAMSHPERTKRHARHLATTGVFRKKIKRALCWLGFWKRRGKQLRDEDYLVIYDMINELLCTGL